MRFAVIGNGSMGKRRIKHLKMAGVDSILGFDLCVDRRREVENMFGIKTVGSVAKLIKQNPDAVFISTPPAEHMTYLKLAIKRGWHFMCENPVYHMLEGLDEISRTVKAKGIIANISCNMRFRPNIIRMKEIIDKGLIGKVLTGWVEIGEWLPDWHPREPYTDYYPSRKGKGGGLDSICDLDWVIDFFGKVEKVVCMADKRTSLDIETKDTVLMTLKFYRGPVIHLHSDMVQRVFTRDAKFVGDKGTVVWRAQERAIYLYTASGQNWTVIKEDKERKKISDEMYFEDTRHFLRCLNGETGPLNTIESNKYALQIVLGALESDENNKFVFFKKDQA